MANSGTDGGCCRCCFSFILTSGLTALFMWLSLRTSNPVCSIQDFYVPALNKSSNSSSTNHTIYFDLKLDNENNDKGIYYDTFNLTISYDTSKGLIPIGNYTVKSFRQGHKKKARRRGSVNSEEVSRAVSNGSMAVFRVHMATKIRFRIIAWKTKKYKLAVGARVEVNENGQKVHKKGIRLKSGAPEINCYRARVMGFLVAFSALGFLLFT
ncbi:hypothetical protein LguiA_035592 [Lonicera macranthoides]